MSNFPSLILLFCVVVGRRPQGTLLGWFASAGSLARVLFPITSGYVEYYLGLSSLLFILTGVLVLSTSVMMYNRRTLSLLST